MDDSPEHNRRDPSEPPIDAKTAGCAMATLYAAFGALALVPLSIAAILWYVLYLAPSARIAAAQSWIETPCEVLHVEKVGLGLDLSYRYEFQGKTYESTRYDLTIGQSGEDDWARDAVVRLKKNPTTVCYVNPSNPAEAVLDRQRRHPSIALILPAIFAAVGLAFLCKVLFGMGRMRAVARKWSHGESPQDFAASDTELPAVDRTPSRAGALLAWVAAFGLVAVFFVLMDGIEFVRGLAIGDIQWLPAQGVVDWRRDSGVSTAFGRVQEFQVRYRVNGREFVSRCYALQAPSAYQIEYDSQRPWRGRLVGTTLYATPRWLLAIPIGMAILLGLGLAGSASRLLVGTDRSPQ